ncbi:MAG: hypothetical protein GX575_06110 [Candidatus Anammoximicrobium sp.]|nr:hypothetical protein [Candidatus Anammoximicrobium sp.]
MVAMTGIKLTKTIGKTASLGLALLATTWMGCGSDLVTAPVSGTVRADGQPVNGGVVTFAPVGGDASAGKPAGGAVQADGTFVLSTESKGDGAILGRHRVIYSPPTVETPPVQEGKHAESPPPSPYAGLIPKEAEVEVKSGSNQIDIDLVPDPAAGVPS